MTTSAPTTDTRSLPRRVYDLAWPVIGENFMETLLGIVDTLIVAQLGIIAIAGVGTAVQVMFFVLSALSAVAVGSAVLVAQAYGGRDLVRASQLARQSMIWSVIISIPLAGLGLLLAEPIIGLFGLEPEVTQIGVDYLMVTMGASVVMTGNFIAGGILRGADDSRTPMLVKVVANVINVFLTYSLVFGSFGFPELGPVGSAWGTFFARGIGLSLILLVLWRGRNGVSIGGGGSWWPDVAIAKQVLTIGIPAALEQVINSVAFFVLTMVVASLGTDTFAAHRIALSAMSLSFMPGLGFGMAATSLIGQSIGAKRPDEAAEAGWIATYWSVLWMGALGILFYFFAPLIMGFFTDEQHVIDIGVSGLQVIALAQPFWAILLVQSSALRGTGDTNYPLRVNAVSMWIGVGISFLWISRLGGDLGTVWICFMTTAPFAAFFMAQRFRTTLTKLSPVPLY
ncbi:MAG: MATE family efflux transporter [Chloroflexota bacterium]